MTYDIIIIGASTSGLHAAELLAQAGKSVGVFEWKDEHLPARRTLIVTPEIRTVFGPIPNEASLHHIQVMEVEADGRRTSVTLEDPDPIVERSAFTDRLKQRAIDAGAEIFYGYRFQEFGPGPTEGPGAWGLGPPTSDQTSPRHRVTV